MQYSIYTPLVPRVYTPDYSEQLWFPLNEIHQPQLLRVNQGKPQLQIKQLMYMYMTVRYNNKGIEMLELPKILHSKSVMNTIPQFLSIRKPPRVSYSYTKTIASRVFNQKKVVEKLDFDSGTEDMQCDCSTCKYCYEPAGHVVTGDLSIIRDAMLRALYS